MVDGTTVVQKYHIHRIQQAGGQPIAGSAHRNLHPGWNLRSPGAHGAIHGGQTGHLQDFLCHCRVQRISFDGRHLAAMLCQAQRGEADVAADFEHSIPGADDGLQDLTFLPASHL